MTAETDWPALDERIALALGWKWFRFEHMALNYRILLPADSYKPGHYDAGGTEMIWPRNDALRFHLDTDAAIAAARSLKMSYTARYDPGFDFFHVVVRCKYRATEETLAQALTFAICAALEEAEPSAQEAPDGAALHDRRER